MTDPVRVSLDLTLRDRDDIKFVEVALGVKPIVIIEPNFDVDPDDVLAFTVDATGFTDKRALGVILQTIAEALNQSAEDDLTRELQAAGPDEFPEGYYRHLAQRRLAGLPDTDDDA